MIKLGPEKAVYSVLLPEVKALLSQHVSDFYMHSAEKEQYEETVKIILTPEPLTRVKCFSASVARMYLGCIVVSTDTAAVTSF
jgi:hypothetical protein